MEVIPFSAPSSFAGLVESKGLLRLEGDELVLEFQSKDSVFGVIKSEVREVRLALNDLSAVAYQKPFYAWSPSLIIRSRSMMTLSEIPGSEQTEVTLQCERKDREPLKRLVSAVTMRISELEMDRLSREVKKMQEG